MDATRKDAGGAVHGRKMKINNRGHGVSHRVREHVMMPVTARHVGNAQDHVIL